MPNFVDQEQKEFEQFYKTSLLWIKLRPIVKRGSLLIFFLADTLLLLFFAWSFLEYGVFDFFTDRALLASIVNGQGDLRAVSLSHAAAGLTQQEVGVLPLTDGRADFYAVVSNPNPSWFVEFNYHFTYSGGETQAVRGFLLPNDSEKTLVSLGVTVSGAPKTASVVLSDVNWTRVPAHTISDYGSWSAERSAFAYDAIMYQRDVDLNGIKIARSSFDLVNKGAYGYWEPTFTIVLRRNASIVGVTTTTAPKLQPGETRLITVNWFGAIPSANGTEIEPNLNIFDPAVFMPPSGTASNDVRERIKVK